MLVRRLITPTLLHSKNYIAPITNTHRNLFTFSKYQPPLPTDIDVGNLYGLSQTSDTQYLTIWEKLSEFSWTSMYTGMDNFSREFLFTVANDWGMGLPAGIVISSLVLRLLFFYPGLMAQVNGMKMKELQPFMTRYQEKMKAAQMSGNKGLMKQATKEFSQARKQKGIDTFIPLLNMAQIPMLITWFLSLRYLTNLPQVYPQLQTQGFMWIKDLSAYDPYFILPVLSACMMSLSITYSPNLNKNNITMPFMIPLIKYMKFMPIISLPITAMFPAAINIYWMTVSFVQCITVGVMHTTYFKQRIGVVNKVLKPKLIQAVIVEEKRSLIGDSSDDNKKPQLAKDPFVVNKSGQVETVKIVMTKPKKNKDAKTKGA